MVFQSSKQPSSSAVAKGGSQSRTIRQVAEYATNNGERPLKKRGIEAFAASSQQQQRMVADDSSMQQLDPRVLAAVKAVGGPSKVSRTATKVALQLASMGTALTVRRVTLPSTNDQQAVVAAQSSSSSTSTTTNVATAVDAIALGALQRQAVCSGAADAGTPDAPDHSVLVVVDTAQTAQSIALRLEALYKIHTLQLTDDSVKFPTWPVAAPAAGADATRCTSAIVVVATLAGLAATNKRSAIWKFCGAMLVLTSSTLLQQLTQGGDNAATREARLNVPARACVVMGSSLTDVSAPVLAALTTPSAPEANSAAHPTTTAAATTVAYMVVEGLMKFQVLCGLLASQAACSEPAVAVGPASQRHTSPRVLSVVVVHFNNPETAAYWCDVLLALNELPKGTTIVCDSEDPREARRLGAEACCTEAIRRVDAAIDAAKGAVVLLSSFGAVPQARGVVAGTQLRYVFVQYDPLVHITGFNRFLAAHVAGGGSSVELPQETPARPTKASKTASNKKGTPPPTPRAVMLSPTPADLCSQRSVSTLGGTPSASSRAYDSVLLLLHPNEAEAAIAVLQGSVDAATCHVQYRATPLPSATTGYLSAQRMKGLHKRVFTIQNRAYEAYRTSMHVYSRLHPSSVYQVRALNLDAYAAALGYEEAPLLDLRTKATPYRPTEDLKKASMKRLVEERRAKRKYAEAELVGTGPEEHIVPSDNEAEN